ncbi:hypothetical protein PCURB6_34560 [Paenibacillus curdlanolyticus]|nr:hypothetical protein PCURB6_34560 [Paenibacillus curdlanolyticus]
MNFVDIILRVSERLEVLNIYDIMYITSKIINAHHHQETGRMQIEFPSNKL